NRGTMSTTSAGQHTCKRAAHRGGRHRRGSASSHHVCVRNGLLVRSQSASPSPSARPSAFVAPIHKRRRHGDHRRAANRPLVATGVAMLGASALVGALVTPVTEGIESADVRLTSAAAPSPIPNELLAALVAEQQRTA